MTGGWLGRSLARRAVLVALAASSAGPTLTCAVRRPVSAGVARQPASVAPRELPGLSRAEFSSLVQNLSEEGGFFHSDNFTSNETSYLHVVDRLREMGVSDGAYLGVGPEQNFTYIAKVHPRIAFIVDIRRQAVIQHLLYKAVFHLSDNRAEFLSRLLSRPLGGAAAGNEEPSIEGLLDDLAQAEAPLATYASNEAQVVRVIEEEFGIPLSPQDKEQLDHVYSAFRKDGLDISFRFGQTGWPSSFRRFPSLRDLVLERDLKGSLGNFLATEADYESVRRLHRQNRIVPIVGDFAGKKALAAVGDYLRKRGDTVSVFYTSNVEQFLFQNGVFAAFAENVRRLPIDERSVFIRAVPGRMGHPAQLPGHRTTTLLQKISVFLADFDGAAYPDYRALVTTHFIAPQEP